MDAQAFSPFSWIQRATEINNTIEVVQSSSQSLIEKDYDISRYTGKPTTNGWLATNLRISLTLCVMRRTYCNSTFRYSFPIGAIHTFIDL